MSKRWVLLPSALVTTCLTFFVCGWFFRRCLNPVGVTQVSHHLTFLSARSPSSRRIKCVLCGSLEGPRAYQRVMSLPPPDMLSARVRALCGAAKGLALMATNQLKQSSKAGLLPMIYSPHRDKVRHSHCLCTWAFIKQPGWALCRRHSNVQGAD